MRNGGQQQWCCGAGERYDTAVIVQSTELGALKLRVPPAPPRRPVGSDSHRVIVPIRETGRPLPDV